MSPARSGRAADLEKPRKLVKGANNFTKRSKNIYILRISIKTIKGITIAAIARHLLYFPKEL